MQITPEYIAGFLDGEGCIQIIRQRQRDRHAWHYRLVVSVTNTYGPIVEALHARYGGVFGSRDPKPNSRGNKRAYYWHASGSRAKGVLDEVVPLLIEKKPQGEMGLAFLRDTANPKGMWHRVTEEQEALRYGYYLALQEAKGQAS